MNESPPSSARKGAFCVVVTAARHQDCSFIYVDQRTLGSHWATSKKRVGTARAVQWRNWRCAATAAGRCSVAKGFVSNESLDQLAGERES